MNDRDSLDEIYDIVCRLIESRNLPMIASAMPYIKSCFGTGYDKFLRNRLSICRTLLDLHIPVDEGLTDVLVCAAVGNVLPVSKTPENYEETILKFFEKDKRVAEVLTTLKVRDYRDESYYNRLIQDRNALIIRLAERSVLVEKLYEWDIADNRTFIHDTRMFFFPMCIYAKEHYRELLGPASILMEKMRNLIAANEALINRYEKTEEDIHTEILSLREDNAAIRAMILEWKSTSL